MAQLLTNKGLNDKQKFIKGCSGISSNPSEKMPFVGETKITVPKSEMSQKTKFFPCCSGCGPSKGMKVSGYMQDLKIYLHTKY